MASQLWMRLCGSVGFALLVSGCAAVTPMGETESPDGRQIKTTADGVVAIETEWSREKQLGSLEKITGHLLARPDSDGNVSEGGEEGHNWKQALVSRDLKDIIGDDNYNYFQLRAQESTNRHGTVQAALYVLAPRLLDRILYGQSGVVGQGGTLVKQNNTFGDGNTISASGGPQGGTAGPGGEASGGEGGPANGGARGIQIGGVGNMQNSEDAYNGFQNRFNSILHGEGCIGKQPQCGDGSEFSPVNDEDEGSVSLF